MAAENTVATLGGLYKKVYGDKPVFPLPEFSILQDLVPFKSSKRTGDSYNSCIVLSDEHGFSYGLADVTITLNAAIAATLKEITIKGAQIVGQASLNYDAASRSTGSEQAFMDTGHLVIQNLMASHSKKLEASLLYGRKGIGTVASLSSQVITLTAASWSDGLMMNLIGASIDVYITGSTVRQANLVVSAVDSDNYAFTVTGTATGIVSTDVCFYSGSVGETMNTNDNECAGLDYIMLNTGALFGITASAYPMWQAQQYACGSAPLTMSKVLSGAAKATARGGLMEETVLLVHPSSWNNLNADQAALSVQNPSDAKASNGFTDITYRGVSGLIKVKAHPAVKRGDAFLFAPKNLKRIGSTDIDNKTPGGSDDIFFHSATLSAYTIRSYSNQAIYAEKPAQMVKFTGIVPA